MNNIFKTTSFTAVFLVLFLSFAYAESEVPEGYDENTELTLKGTIKEFGRQMRGPVIVQLQSGTKDYRVITAPPWFIAQEGIEFRTGGAYEVTGSKFISRDGNLYIIASRLKDLATGKTIQLRDASCMPRWKGRRMMRGMNQP